MASERLKKLFGCDCWCHLQSEDQIFWQGSAKTRGCRYCGFVLGMKPQPYCRYNNPRPKYKIPPKGKLEIGN